jgi:hypothetical protein
MFVAGLQKLARREGQTFSRLGTCLKAFACLSLFPGEGAAQVWEKFLDHAKTDIGAHGNAKAHGPVSGRVLALGQP